MLRWLLSQLWWPADGAGAEALAAALSGAPVAPVRVVPEQPVAGVGWPQR